MKTNVTSAPAVLILTYNEEDNIKRTLEHLRCFEKIIMLDSYSTDATLDIANTFKNVEVYQRKFDTHGNQWNYGLSKCNSEWVLSLDADYTLTEDFIAETYQKVSSHTIAAFYSHFEFCVFGKPVKSNNTTPRPVLFRKDLCIYYDDGHTQRLNINGSTAFYKCKILHDDRKPLSRWINNQAKYSLLEAEKLVSTPANQLSAMSKIRKTKIFAPFVVFFYCLFMKGLFFDGWRGWHYTLQRTIVEMLLALRLAERIHLEKQLKEK